MGTKDAAKIRAALAAKGWGKADISVRNDSYSMGSTVHVTIKRAEIPLTAVEKIAESFSRVYRDDSGEILGGANMFVSVKYADGVLDAAEEKARAQFALGRRRWGAYSLNECDRFTWDIFLSEGSVGRFVTKADHSAPGAGLVRVLAAAGELALLDQTESGNGAPPAGAPANDAVLTRDEQDAAERAEPTARLLDPAAEGAAAVARDDREHARITPIGTPLERMHAASKLINPAVLPRFALVDATEAESATVRGAIAVLTSAVEAGTMPARAALEALAHLVYRVGLDRR